jgi:hypothetical protein
MGVGMAGQMQQAFAAPPPLPAGAVQWFAGIGGQQAGPFDASALAAQVATGKLTRETLVWKAGMGAWTPAGQVAELASLFGQVPPPLPR